MWNKAWVAATVALGASSATVFMRRSWAPSARVPKAPDAMHDFWILKTTECVFFQTPTSW